LAFHIFRNERHHPHFTPFAAKYADNGVPRQSGAQGLRGHHFMHDPVAHALKHFVISNGMVLRKALR